MKPIWLLFFIFIAMPVFAAAQSPGASHLKAATAMLDAAEVGKNFETLSQQMIDVQAQQMPEDKRKKFATVMQNFMKKYVSYEVLKPKIAQIYAEEFTEKELNEMAVFYATPTGKKSMQKMPMLFQKGSELGIKAVQEHQDELKKAMEEAFKE